MYLATIWVLSVINSSSPHEDPKEADAITPPCTDVETEAPQCCGWAPGQRSPAAASTWWGGGQCKSEPGRWGRLAPLELVDTSLRRVPELRSPSSPPLEREPGLPSIVSVGHAQCVPTVTWAWREGRGQPGAGSGWERGNERGRLGVFPCLCFVLKKANNIL